MRGGDLSDTEPELEARTSALVRTFDQTFPAEQIVLLLELTEHNEPGVALEMLEE